MDLSVLIPSHRRAQTLTRCLQHLAAQTTTRPFEVVVGIDGDDADSEPIVPGPVADRTRLIQFPKIGYIAIRHRLVNQARGRSILSMNDDAMAGPGLLDAHLDQLDHQGPRVVTGPASWAPVQQPTLFDDLVQRSSLVFFKTPSSATPVKTDYRSCYGLNLSAHTELVRELGGFPDLPDTYGYDDIELAHRLKHRGHAELWHAPDAIVTHEHRYTPPDMLRREYLLGRAAWAYAGINPAFARDLFRRDIRATEEIDAARIMLAHCRGDAERIEASFRRLAQMPSNAAAPELLETLAEHWLPTKRYLWRWGLLDAADGLPSRWTPLSEAPTLPDRS